MMQARPCLCISAAFTPRERSMPTAEREAKPAPESCSNSRRVTAPSRLEIDVEEVVIEHDDSLHRTSNRLR